MKCVSFILIVSLLLAGCNRQPETKISLTVARHDLKTRLTRHETDRTPVPEPPSKLFRIVHYASPVGNLAAYLSPTPTDTMKHPAIIWITGGDYNTIDNSVWQEAAPSNDQSAHAFRDAGIIMMFPSLRGGNMNPGYKEGFYGEVDDILAAADYLAKQNFVDPNRIYLGGHSTGGTLVLLTAESSSRFRAVFSFGPVKDVAKYGKKYLPFDVSEKKELELRTPERWLHSIVSPVFVFEGTRQPGNLDSLQAMSGASANPMIRFYAVRGADHFSILAPTTQLIANKILGDRDSATKIVFTSEELNKPFSQ